MKNLLFTIAAGLMLVTGAAHADAWKLDSTHTTVGFSVRHVGVSRVKGSFGKFDGTIDADADGKLKSVVGTVEVDSINTANADRDKHLKSDDFFGVAKFPKMSLKSKSITFEGEKVTVEADLTIRDVTKSVKLTGEYLGVKKNVDFGYGKNNHAGYTFTGKINRQDFGLKFNKIAEGVSVVGDEVTLEFELEIQQPVAAPASK